MLDRIPERIQQELLSLHQAVPRQQMIGGLSTAVVIRCDSPQGPLCLRRWPMHASIDGRLRTLHQALKTLTCNGIQFTPELHPAMSGETLICDGTSHWELGTWLPGQADYGQRPSDGKLESALQALAKVHSVWSEHSLIASSPAAQVRWERLRSLLEERAFLRWPSLCVTPMQRQLASETVGLLESEGTKILERLAGIADAPVRLHYVIRDIHDQHVLFSEGQVTGLIDFGAARVDEPATDLARLLGTLEPFDAPKRRQGWEHYNAHLPGTDFERVAILDQASCLLSAAQWAEWTVVEQRAFNASPESLQRRWQTFLARLRHSHTWQ